MNITIVCATPMSQKEFWAKAPLSRYLRKHHADHEINHSIKYDNTDGLPEIYNRHLQSGWMNENITLFVHDDVSIEDDFLVSKLNAAMKEYDIVGLAGGSNVTVKSPTLWHVMTEKPTWSGAVAHRWPTGEINMSHFGSTPKRCVIVDGLFIAINTAKIKKHGLWFDPKYTFHHYDLQFGIDANALQLKVGTWPIFVVHSGLGDSFQSEDWRKSEKQFLETNI